MKEHTDSSSIVITGILTGLVSTITSCLLAYFLLPKFDQELVMADRLALACRSLVFPALIFFLMIVKVGAQRYNNPSQDPTKVEANTQMMKVDLRVLSNTQEQLIIFLINIFALATLLPFEYLSLIPTYSILFVIGRLVFWIAYHKHVLWRSIGFVFAVLPAICAFIYSCLKIVYLR